LRGYTALNHVHFHVRDLPEARWEREKKKKGSLKNTLRQNPRRHILAKRIVSFSMFEETVAKVIPLLAFLAVYAFAQSAATPVPDSILYETLFMRVVMQKNFAAAAFSSQTSVSGQVRTKRSQDSRTRLSRHLKAKERRKYSFMELIQRAPLHPL
jgi:hypothetical protein